MPARAVPKEKADAIVKAVQDAVNAGYAPMGKLAPRGTMGALGKAAADLGVSTTTLRSQVEPGGIFERVYGLKVDWEAGSDERRAARGEMGFEPVLPGYEIKTIASQTEDGAWIKQAKAPGAKFEMPDGHIVKGVSTLVDGSGRTIASWIKTREGEYSVDDVTAAIRAGFEDFTTFAPVRPAEPLDYRDMLALFPLADLHMGMQAFGKETMGPNWDLKIAKREISALAAEIMEATPPCKVAVILGGGDAVHADNNSNCTAKSGNSLDIDGRYDKILHATTHLFCEIVEMALARHEHVVVRVLKGNHDEHASVAIGLGLQMRYHDHPRVTVDTTPSHFWFYRFGSVMLGALHGHSAKPDKLPALMATLKPQDWAASVHRYGHAFHVHHASKIADEIMGVKVETHRTPAPKDSWHANEGFLSGRELRSIIYHPERGEFGGAVRTAA